jgi:small subunit ribosomal protein S21
MPEGAFPGLPAREKHCKSLMLTNLGVMHHRRASPRFWPCKRRSLLKVGASVYYQIRRRPEIAPSFGPEFDLQRRRSRKEFHGIRALDPGPQAGKGTHMIKVKSRGNETVDQMLRRFKKLCEKEGLIKDMKRVSYYEKPSEKRRRRLRKAQSRLIKMALEAGTA